MTDINTRVRIDVPGAPFDGATGTVIEATPTNDPLMELLYGATHHYGVQLDEVTDEYRRLADLAREERPDEDVRDDVIYLLDGEFEALAA